MIYHKHLGILVASTLLLGTLSTPGRAEQSQPGVSPPGSPSQSVPKDNSVAQKLLGKWQAKDPSGDTLIFIFALESKMFILLPSSSGPTTATEVRYRINSTTKPMQLDVLLDKDSTVLTIFELTPDGKQLRIQLAGTQPGQSRPTAFTSNATVFERVSNSTTIPQKTQALQLQH